MTTALKHDYDKMFSAVKETCERFDRILERLGFVNAIDEVALLFINPFQATEFLREAVTNDGVLLFNSATDHVHTLPLRTCYDVRYDFLTVPSPYWPENRIAGPRIEAMHLTDGYSPLHFAALMEMKETGNPATPIHASFKCDDEEDYAIAVDRLRTAGWEAAQRCESTYGRFSYWTPLNPKEWFDDALRDLYLKPRVNVRDEREERA